MSDNTRKKKARHSHLRMATFNIRDGRKSNLQIACRAMRGMNVDFGVFTETKINGIYSKSADGYKVVATKARKGKGGVAKGGVALFYREAKGWSLESTKTFGPNVIRTTLVSGQKRWNIIGAYVSPSETDGSTLECIAQARRTVGNNRWPTILLGDLNVNLDDLRADRAGGDRRFATAALMDSMGIRSMRAAYRQCKKLVGKFFTWTQRRNGKLLGSVCDHILTDGQGDFLNCQIKNPRYVSDHKMLVATLRVGSEKHHQRYTRSRAMYSIRPIRIEKANEADRILAELAENAKGKEKTNGRKVSWISTETWSLIDQRATARRVGNNESSDNLKRAVNRALKRDRKVRCATVGQKAQSFLEDGKIRKAFGALKGWYRDAGPQPTKPSREDLNMTRSEYANLFAEELPSEDPIPVHAPKFTINDEPPGEDEIVEALGTLRNNKAAGASGLTAEDLKSWHEDAQETEEGEEPDEEATKLWKKVLELVRLAFEEGVIPLAFSQGIFVLIPKAKSGEFRGIALLEVIYKLVSSIINRRMQVGITFDDAVHGFRPGRGTGTAILEAKLLAQLQMRSDEPLYMVFMDLKKAYDTLDRTQALRILREYGVGEKLLRIISTIWENDTMVPRQSGYFGRAFGAHRGVRQGDIMSPVIFNVMVDAVIRHWRATDSTGIDLETLLFYADDGLLAGTDAQQVQDSLDVITKGFLSVGLKMNATKTEYMTMEGGIRVVRLSDEAYNRQCTGKGKTHREKSLEKVTCELCGSIVNRQHLPVHQKKPICINGRKDYIPPPPVWTAAAEQAEPPERGARTYRMSIPNGHTGEVVCPVDGCDASMLLKQRTSLRKHFRLRHLEDTIIIAEEGPLPLPRCNLCGFFSNFARGKAHQESAECRNFAEKRHRHFQQKRQQMAREVSFNVNGEKIDKVSEFKYLGRILEETDDDDHAANRQLTRARARWGRIAKILTIDGASPRVMGYFYKAIIQTVLLYGSESWTLTIGMIGRLRSFHHRVARYITGRHIKELEDGTYFCPSMKEVLKAAGMETIEVYMDRRRNTVRKYAATSAVYGRCIRSTAMSTNVNKVVWWEIKDSQNDVDNN